MPTTFVGLLIFIAFLTPGFLYASQRHALVPQAEQSTLMETTSVVSISLATNAVVLALFGLVRWARPKDTPDVGRLLGTGSEYAIEHLSYVFAWGTGLLIISCVLAVTAARSKRVRRRLAKYLRPVIIETSAWCEVFDPPERSYPYAGVELADGTFVSGTVQWFSTHLEESGDRDLALGPPLQFRSAKGRTRELEVQRWLSPRGTSDGSMSPTSRPRTDRPESWTTRSPGRRWWRAGGGGRRGRCRWRRARWRAGCPRSPCRPRRRCSVG